MAKDNHLDRIKAVKRVSRIETGGPHGKTGTLSDKTERRVRRMGTKEWLEEVEEEEEFLEEDDHGPFEADLDSTKIMVVCSLCGNPTLADTAHLHQGKLIGECCWDERLRTTE
jgi:formylmethanofuran dehydrogenase subunit E